MMPAAPLRVESAGVISAHSHSVGALSSRSTSVDDHLERSLAERESLLTKHMRALQMEVDERRRALSFGPSSPAAAPGVPSSSRSSLSGHGSTAEAASKLPNSSRSSSLAGYGSAVDSSFAGGSCSPSRAELPVSSRSSRGGHASPVEANFFGPPSPKLGTRSTLAAHNSQTEEEEDMFDGDELPSCSVDEMLYSAPGRASLGAGMPTVRAHSSTSLPLDSSHFEEEEELEQHAELLRQACSKSSHERFEVTEPLAPSEAEKEDYQVEEPDKVTDAQSRKPEKHQFVWEVPMFDMNTGPRRERRMPTLSSAQEGFKSRLERRAANAAAEKEDRQAAAAAADKEGRTAASASRREGRVGTAGSAQAQPRSPSGPRSPPHAVGGGMQANSHGAHSSHEVPDNEMEPETESWFKNLRSSEEDQNTYEDPLVFGSGFKPPRNSGASSTNSRPTPFGHRPSQSGTRSPQSRSEANFDSKFESRSESRFGSKPSGQPHDRSNPAGPQSSPDPRMPFGSRSAPRQQQSYHEKARTHTESGGEQSRPRTRPQPQPQAKPQAKFQPGPQGRAYTGPEARGAHSGSSPRSPGQASPPPRGNPGRASRHDRTNRTRGGRAPSAPPGPSSLGQDLQDKSVTAMQQKLLDALKGELNRLKKVHSPADRKKHFFKLCLQWHPDKNPSNVQFATKGFQMLQEKKGVLLAGT